MIERNRDTDAILFGQPHHAAQEIAVVENIMMRQRDALGRSGCAAGELNVDGIVELQCAGERRERVAVAPAAYPRHLFERNRSGTNRPTDLDHRAQLRQPRRMQITWLCIGKLGHQRVQHLHVVRGLERGGRDERGASYLG